MGTVYSMTGFASAKTQLNSNELSCEIRSLNSRYLEIYIKLPLMLKDMEDSLREIIREEVHRGKVHCSIYISSTEPLLQNLRVDEGTVLMYKNLLDQIRKIAGIEEPVRLSDLLEFKDIFTFDEETHIDEVFQSALQDLVREAVARLNATRSSEGAHLRDDLEQRLETITRLVGEIHELAKDNARIEFDKLYQRLLSRIDEKKIDRNRLEMELALISDRVDISEEVVRMNSHLELFRQTLAKGSPIGKKLNFILQEMHRETNTMASKNTIFEVSRRIVAIKEEVERMREQVQNIE
ncbi:MAG: YicC family protein [Calditrichaeota bacterium]|nr:MAG: YicC family protein [Calditrichota bacterium]